MTRSHVLCCHECDTPSPVVVGVAVTHHWAAIDALRDAATLTETDPRAAARAFNDAADHLEHSNIALGLAEYAQEASA